MTLGECLSCSGWVVNPITEKCPYCEPRCAPLKALVLHEVPEGTRIATRGTRLFAPDGTVIYDRQETPDPPEVQRLRKLLEAYDEGILPARWLQFEVETQNIRKLVDGVKKHGKLRWLTSSCAREIPPTETFKMEVTICGSDTTVTRIDD